MRDDEGNKIRAKTMTEEQAQLVLERMLERTNKKIYNRALRFAMEWSPFTIGSAGRPTKARSAKA